MRSSASEARRRIREGHLTAEQIRDVLKACERPQDRLLFKLIYSYGLRATEAAEMPLKDIDFDRGLIEVVRQKGSESGTMPLLPELRDDLEAWLKVRPESRFLFPAPANPARSYTRWNVYRIFRETAERAGLPKSLQHPHVLKHSIATHLLERKGNIRAVQKWLGLKSLETVVIYAEVTGTMTDETAGLARELLGRKKGKP